MLRPKLLSLLLLSASLPYHVVGTCYNRNGTAAPSNYKPCSTNASSALSTVCCALDHDICVDNGLCLTTVHLPNRKVYYRESCTKQDWDAGGCQELCSNGTENQRNSDVVVTPCGGDASSTEWCCGGTTDCCDDKNNIPRYTIAVKFGDPIPTPKISSTSSMASPTSSSSMSTAMSSIISSSASTTASHTPQSNKKDGLSTGAAAGIGIGAAAGVILCLLLGILIGRRRQQNKTMDVAALEIFEQYPPKETYRHDDMKRVQLPGIENGVHELPGPYEAELSGSHDTSEVSVTSPNQRRNHF